LVQHAGGEGSNLVVRFECRTDIAAPAALVFDLSLSIDGHLDSMRGFGEQAVAGVTTGRIGPGQQVTWRARHFGIWWRMTSRIGHLQRPVLFVDEQVSGPFAGFRHEHRFHAQPHAQGASAATSGVTQLVDVVEFRAPLGLLGRLAEILVLGWYVRRLIESRNVYLKQQAEGVSHTGLPPDRT
jgi:ligand-binding SRPBCC domain-containing protein